MIHRILTISFFCLCVAIGLPLSADHSIVLGIRQTENDGVGYGHGYTTIETLMMPCIDTDIVLPFADLRVHRFDNNKYAANAGLGLRYYRTSHDQLLGANIYYDYRQTRHAHFNNIGAGFEVSGQCFCLRGNGYLPVGRTSWPSTKESFECPNGFTTSFRKFHNSYAGADLELEANLCRIGPLQLYIAAGPYFLQEQHRNRKILGTRYRVEIDFGQCFIAEFLYSHDPIFRTKAQGQIGIYIPFEWCTMSGTWDSCFCYIKELMTRRIYRREIIPENSHKHWKVD